MSDRPFKCPEPGCTYAANQRGTLTKHQGRVHPSVREGSGRRIKRPLSPSKDEPPTKRLPPKPPDPVQLSDANILEVVR